MKCPKERHYHFEVILLEKDAIELHDMANQILDRGKGLACHFDFDDKEIDENHIFSQVVKDAFAQLFGQAVSIEFKRDIH